ncbi:hypothetical protein LFE_0105 [Leptospirillum ferrooxidans C2-3]|uniref:Uncharacterized protein n=1 Tax=Leptospirillum ferrooxidans (strain C2-3) TaxID=1162668 RepID=I0IKN5_LEPFC|nr:hypothetical protein LFE_0105 [Leptospirillum ferrooxidans C2-3]
MGFKRNRLVGLFMTIMMLYAGEVAQATVYTYTTINDPNATVYSSDRNQWSGCHRGRL